MILEGRPDLLPNYYCLLTNCLTKLHALMISIFNIPLWKGRELKKQHVASSPASLVCKSFSQEELSMGLQTIKLQIVCSREPMIWESTGNLIVTSFWNASKNLQRMTRAPSLFVPSPQQAANKNLNRCLASNLIWNHQTLGASLPSGSWGL